MPEIPASFVLPAGLGRASFPPGREVVAFVREYEEARGAPFTRSELAEVAAAATYARAYKARCEHAIDRGGTRWRGSSRERLERDGPFRFDRA